MCFFPFIFNDFLIFTLWYGSTGPQGPATITVGTTTTLNPGTEASVTNNGSLENVVLDFNIPMGPTGPKGDIGPTGPQGEK